MLRKLFVEVPNLISDNFVCLRFQRLKIHTYQKLLLVIVMQNPFSTHSDNTEQNLFSKLCRNHIFIDSFVIWTGIASAFVSENLIMSHDVFQFQ